jgi:hypothetical protein
VIADLFPWLTAGGLTGGWFYARHRSKARAKAKAEGSAQAILEKLGGLRAAARDSKNLGQYLWRWSAVRAYHRTIDRAADKAQSSR